jgi:hypothetical protein
MISTAKQAIERKIQNIVRKSLMDWPMDFGVETAVLNNVSGDYHEFGVFEGRSFIKNTLAFRKMLGAQDYPKPPTNTPLPISPREPIPRQKNCLSKMLRKPVLMLLSSRSFLGFTINH